MLFAFSRSWAVITVSPGGDSHVAPNGGEWADWSRRVNDWDKSCECRQRQGKKKKKCTASNVFKTADIISNMPGFLAFQETFTTP